MLTLRRTDQGAAVVAVQGALASGAGTSAADGTFDAATDAAVRTFQAVHGLTVDGIVGNDTLHALGLSWASIHPVAFRAEVARLAHAQWKRWNDSGKHLETDPAMTSVLQDYYRIGVGQNVSALDLQSADWQHTHLWSAVFISWVMRTAGADDRFEYSTAHQRYIAAAKQNRTRSDVGNPFWAFAIEEVTPEIGDVVCKGREGSGARYDNIDDGHRPCHCDIVVEVGAQSLTTIGGNVDQTVGRKTLRTTAGVVDLAAARQQEYFAVIRVMEW